MQYDFDPFDSSEPVEEDPLLAPAGWATLTGDAFWENLIRAHGSKKIRIRSSRRESFKH